MHQQPGDRSCATDAIGGDHWGPINVSLVSEPNLHCTLIKGGQVYLAKVDDALTAVGSSAGWFKVSEMGLPSNNPEYWATEVLNVRLWEITYRLLRPTRLPG